MPTVMRPPPILGTRPKDQITQPRGGVNVGPGLEGGYHGFTRTVQPNELMSTHAETLARGDNRLIKDARMRGARAGASRGGINSNLAAGMGEEAALGQVAEMAAQQAGAYGNAATQNLESLGRQRIAAEGNATSENVAGISAGASMYGDDLNFESNRLGREQDRELTLSGRDFTRSEREGTQGWQSGEAERDRDFTHERDARTAEADYRYGQQGQDAAARRDAAQYMFRNLIDNPEEFDPEILTGLLSFWDRFYPSTQPNYAKPGVVPPGGG